MTLLTRPKKTVATVIVATDGSGDTTDIQTGINMLPATGGVVYIKEGTYNVIANPVTGAIIISTNNVALMGAGRATIIEVSGPGPGIGYGIYANGPDNLIISDLYIHGDGLQTGIYMVNTENTFINRVWIENCGNGMDLGGNLLMIFNCIINNNNTNGIYASLINECIIINNFIYENVQNGIVVNGDDNIISGNTIMDNDVNDTATYDGIQLASGCDYNTITNNRCRDNDRYEINITTSVPANTKNLILGNVCVGTDHVGAINDGGTGTVGLATNSLHSIVA